METVTNLVAWQAALSDAVDEGASQVATGVREIA